MSSPLPFFLFPLLPLTGNLPQDVSAPESHAIVESVPAPVAGSRTAAPKPTPCASPAAPIKPVKPVAAEVCAAPAVTDHAKGEPSAAASIGADVHCFR